MTDNITVFETGTAFMAAMNRHQAARWSPQSGVDLVFQYGDTGRELMLQIQPGQQYPGMLRNMLGRRHQQAAECDGCHLCLNGSDVLILWWPLPPTPDTYPQLIERLFELAGLTLPPVSAERAVRPQTGVGIARPLG
ncbi:MULTISPECIES: HrpV family type III secretion system protein [Dickeya]|uniref:HrpV n=1 Tax=Dickeya fangzhongdai TaxID=1778540 RepID=A0A2K8QMF1_9GAMM|nr:MULTISPECIES: HrpV family type III secretion system protein [Dickeya]ATZ94664.1 hypothetical protein CVE23_12170 [Dickeya fangzhongdai]AYH48356.1 hypothetical protein B6N31_12025 [Dickeya fangzhongdai]QOH48104.1 hypothetical protein DYD82_12235 [Dickeya fangzhongdai]QOH52407.1 hypothetical protein DYD83_12235 [Dickeya fangzhongdai]WES88357.1 HrpV family type III secretion system protein [Dickeya fangzhongdai]